MRGSSLLEEVQSGYLRNCSFWQLSIHFSALDILQRRKVAGSDIKVVWRKAECKEWKEANNRFIVQRREKRENNRQKQRRKTEGFEKQRKWMTADDSREGKLRRRKEEVIDISKKVQGSKTEVLNCFTLTEEADRNHELGILSRKLTSPLQIHCLQKLLQYSQRGQSSGFPCCSPLTSNPAHLNITAEHFPRPATLSLVISEQATIGFA